MKKKIFILLVILATQINFAQPEFGPPHKMGEKFRQLEKIKLLEILNLDEEIAVRFFTRKNAYTKRQKELLEKNCNIFDKIEAELKNENTKKDKLVLLLRQSNNIDLQLQKGKGDFINSVKDILTTEQIAKLVLFEHKFKKDVRDLLIKGGKKKFLKRRGSKSKFE